MACYLMAQNKKGGKSLVEPITICFTDACMRYQARSNQTPVISLKLIIANYGNEMARVLSRRAGRSRGHFVRSETDSK